MSFVFKAPSWDLSSLLQALICLHLSIYGNYRCPGSPVIFSIFTFMSLAGWERNLPAGHLMWNLKSISYCAAWQQEIANIRGAPMHLHGLLGKIFSSYFIEGDVEAQIGKVSCSGHSAGARAWEMERCPGKHFSSTKKPALTVYPPHPPQTVCSASLQLN